MIFPERSRSWALLACVSFLLGACGGGSGDTSTAATASAGRAPVEVPLKVERVEGFTPTQSPAAPKSVAVGSADKRPTPGQVKLGPVDVAKAAGDARPPGRPVQIGVARSVSDTATAQGLRSKLSIRMEEGFASPTGAVSFTSPGASALRLGLLVTRLPAGARVRGYSQGGQVAFEVSGEAILASIERNRSAGDFSDEGRTWWSPPVEHEEVTLEISVPRGTPAGAVEVSVPRLSHIVVKKNEIETFKGIGDSQSCEVDVTCRAEADNASRATARMSWVLGGASYACTGTLMADSISSATPYFLSANHCLSTQTEASSLTTYWFFRASSCNSGVLSAEARQVDGGAALLYTSSATDTAFMRLNGTPPAGAAYSGWSAAAPTVGQSVTTVHHPQADLQKFSQGQITGYLNCSVDAFTPLSCSTGTSTGRFVSTRWSVGTTESGSSGSGLFETQSGRSYLIGQLTGGSASCQRPTGLDAYGRFDRAYADGLNRWLSPAAPVTGRHAIFRFYNASTGAHFFTRNAAERDWIVASNAAFNYEGIAYYAYDTQVEGSSPVFRFYNVRTGRHFYTISEGERDYVASNPDYSYEGVSWYGQAGSGGSAAPVYRFYNASVATHFYTINAAEKDYVAQSIPAWRLEGVGYYAWTTP